MSYCFAQHLAILRIKRSIHIPHDETCTYNKILFGYILKAYKFYFLPPVRIGVYKRTSSLANSRCCDSSEQLKMISIQIERSGYAQKSRKRERMCRRRVLSTFAFVETGFFKYSDNQKRKLKITEFCILTTCLQYQRSDVVPMAQSSVDFGALAFVPTRYH